jgi:transcriptional regulator with XRE-family HTH domain
MADSKRKRAKIAAPDDSFAPKAVPRPDPRRDHFADNLRRLMGVHCAHGALVAEALGVSRQTVSDLIGQKRRHPPSLDTLYKAADLFQVDPDTLYRRPFFEWAGEYFTRIGGPDADESGKPARYLAIGDRLHDAEVALRDRDRKAAKG